MLQTASPSDSELLEAAQHGDEQAFTALHERYRAYVYRIALRIVGHRDDAEDICQDVFLRLYERPPILEGPKALQLWLARVTTNAALNVLRSRRRARFHWLRWFRLDWLDRSAGTDGETHVETSLLVRNVLERLSERDRALLALRASGMSYEDIAATLGLRQSSVGTLLARAERRFRQHYEALVQKTEEVAQ